jgi:hypothetical protein
MPYVECIQCHLRSFSAARYSTRDTCPACGAPLRRDRDPAGRMRLVPETVAALRRTRSSRAR